MKLIRFLAIIALAAGVTVGCADGITDPGETPGPITTFAGTAATECVTARPKTVLIDPTHDGGTWWFPQSSAFHPDQPHQGKALADTLRGRGFTVTELGRGATMAPDSMMKYSIIIRAGYYYDARHPGYSEADLGAYDAFTNCSRALIILGEYLRDGRRDDLADRLGVRLDGIIDGPIDAITPHPLTAGVTSLPYIAGSFLTDESNPGVQVLGRVGTKAVMGLVTGRSARIFFIGDVNGIQRVPMPFVDNLIRWAE